MKVLLTGSTGYIGRRLLPELVLKGYQVICPVRDKRRFDFEDFDEEFLYHVEVIETDFTDLTSLESLPKDIDIAFYLIHSMSSNNPHFDKVEEETARNFATYISGTKSRQIIYLGGISNDPNLSQHLDSRLNVENTLRSVGIPVTVLRAAIIIGSGSASFEIIRDLVEKLPIMIAPKWLKTRCQPIAISNVLQYLLGVIDKNETFGKVFDIGGSDILTYKQMLLGLAKIRKLKRWIISVPVLTPKLSSLWLHFVTSTNYYLARNLVDSLKNEVIVSGNEIDKYVPIRKLSYEESLKKAFQRLRNKSIVSSWKDSFDSTFSKEFLNQVEVPQYGCFFDVQRVPFERKDSEVVKNIWEIGGERGWYYGTFLWKIRGFLDKLIGGVGLRRGRRSPNDLKNGDALDFWRVLYANKKEKRLVLFAEMKLPGEAWLEFRVQSKEGSNMLIQKATFRPRGLLGRIYWYLVTPFHILIFNRMARNIVNYNLH